MLNLVAGHRFKSTPGVNVAASLDQRTLDLKVITKPGYCRYYMGRRIPEEDTRQIRRWKQIKRPFNLVDAVEYQFGSFAEFPGSPSVISQARKR